MPRSSDIYLGSLCRYPNAPGIFFAPWNEEFAGYLMAWRVLFPACVDTKHGDFTMSKKNLIKQQSQAPLNPFDAMRAHMESMFKDSWPQWGSWTQEGGPLSGDFMPTGALSRL